MDEDFTLVEQWERASEQGLTQKEFCTIMGVRESTLRRKIKQAPQKTTQLPTTSSNGLSAAVSQSGLRAAVFDIETTSFTATGYEGIFVCGCILPIGERDAEVITYKTSFEPDAEQASLAQFLHALSGYAFIVGHYIQNFDLPWLRTRTAHLGLPHPATWMLFDTCLVARSLNIMSKRKSLAFLVDHFKGLDPEDTGEDDKTALYPHKLSLLRSRHEEEYTRALNFIVDHCQRDVRMNLYVFDQLYPLAMTLNQAAWKKTRW